MAKSGIYAGLILALTLPLVAPVVAQDAARDAGILAFREKRFDDALRHFERATTEDPDDSEAYFLLARLYSETPLKNRREAQRALNKAIELEPENVQYLVAHLIHLREESWNFITDKLREARRRTLAQKILEMDPRNAFAHEELGIGYIRDFWRYRNAVMMPGFDLARRWRVPEQNLERDLENVIPLDLEGATTDPGAPFDIDDPNQLSTLLTVGREFIPEFEEPGQVFLADEFDVDKLERNGVPVRDLSQRASRVYNRAVMHLSIALEANPRQRSVYDQLIKVYALRGDWSEALTTLQQMYVFFPDDPGMWMYLGLANYRGGNPEAGAKSFERALALSDEELQRVFNDIRFIVPDDEKDQYDADPVAYASRFWTSKDPRYLTPYNERKIEHYSRLVYADLLYGVPQVERRGWDTERGQILIRYGVPNVDVVIIPDQSIDDTGPDRFASSGGVADPLAAREESVNELKAFEVLNTYNIWDYGNFRFIFEDPFRTGEYRLYSPSAEAISQRALPWKNDYVIAAAETIRETPETYEYQAPGRQIELPYLVNSFKGSDGSADVYVHYGIPVTDYDAAADFIEVTANEGTFVIAGDRSIEVEQRRTIYGLQVSQIQDFDEQSLWINTQTLRSAAGEKEVSVELELGGGGSVAVQRREVTIPEFVDSSLRMSDVMLAYGVEETFDDKPLASGEVLRNGYSIRPAPWSVFSREQPIYLYFEFYNLALQDGASRYEIEGRLEKRDDAKGVRRVVRSIFGGDDASVSVRQPGTGSGADDAQYLIMDASDVEPGLYTLVVLVKDMGTGKEVERSKDLYLE